ncbi:hypothetical protein ACF9IK_14755 [Kitasatospora hibisci]|uniref:hypothetical protein n=1 Tax=Kitasatospora hibisci TaxID=3369522 RepID=UPI003754E114
MSDLRLVHLTYAGSGRPTANVEFDPELTVIYGASDTGKSFIAESVEYMLGGTSLNPVPEADGYSQILLGLLLPDGSPLTLVRTLDSKTVFVHRADLRELVTRYPDEQVTANHTARSKNSLSVFLLRELGLSDFRIRKGGTGTTRPLALSDLVHLSVIPETRMVAPLSPVLHSSSATGSTAAASVMRLLLTGEGDTEVDPGPNEGQRRVNRGNIVLLDRIVLDLHAKLSTQETVGELRTRHARIQASLDEHSSSLSASTARHLEAVASRARIAQELADVESRLSEVGALVTKFRLLEAQYRSDLARLEMVTEAGSILGYFNVGTCVFCGAEPEHQHPGHGDHETTQLHIAVQHEAVKTTSLLSDLLPTIDDLTAQFEALVSRRAVLIDARALAEQQLAEAEALLDPARGLMEEILHSRSAVERDLELHQRIEELEERRSVLDAGTAAPASRSPEFIRTRFLSRFDEVLRQTLEDWGVPSVEYAEYDQYEMDIRAGNRLRSTRGKGVRSVLHSAFTTALARYCRDNDSPHTGFVVLDSPVVTYRDPVNDPVGDDVVMTSSVVERFYRGMLDFPGQAVIIENGDPPADVIANCRSYLFSGTGNDRRGFFPLPAPPRGHRNFE